MRRPDRRPHDPSSRHSSVGRPIALWLIIISCVVIAGCAVGPDNGPPLVVGDDAHGGGTSSSVQAPSGPPALQSPRADLGWRDCRDDLVRSYGFATPASDVILECASFRTAATPGTQGLDTVTVGAVRARLTRTAREATPVVLTTGTDLPSAAALMLYAAGPNHEQLLDHPVVALNRRGTGNSDPIDCLTRTERSTLVADGFQPPPAASGAQRSDRLAAAAASAADGCTETLSPHQLDYTSAFAAADIEKLRTIWQVDRLGLVGVGQGGDVALAYAGLYPSRVARLVLDTPTPYRTDTKDRAQNRAAGVQAALDGFADQCRAVDCSLGADPGAAVRRLLDRAAAGDLSGFSDTDVLAALTTSLAVGPLDRRSSVTAAADILSAAGAGDTSRLQTAVSTAHALRDGDGQLVGRCNDVAATVGRSTVDQLLGDWTTQYRLTGTTTALDLLRCNGWSAGPPAPTVTGLDVPVLLLSAAADTLNGNGGIEAVTKALVGARVSVGAIGWQGVGYSAWARSDCAGGATRAYLDTGTAPPSTDCPA
ncbi:alpha/beta fold hydrolase [Williamsia sterculiae]|uniref:TAP-like protein n=1 Tax=Williamsia sterculiae TaxID=1344003 RepID=A0A1N7EFV0_9NOCA|nr:alpha/beta fold hydrolase [Williamsia sterculiae]SIR86914.1 TAP-like protein [Williamsia sterculiae]